MEILQRDNPILRNQAKAIPIRNIQSPEIQTIINKMSKAMHAQKDGVAIAAPQIGESIQIFVISGELLEKADPSYKGGPADLVFINPQIVRYSKEKEDVEEGCLSVRWLYGKVKRSKKVSLSAYNEKGEKIERGASGLMAQIFQHECDHLNGVLFTDKAHTLWEMTEEEIRELQNA